MNVIINEVWKPIIVDNVHYENYNVSNFGRVQNIITRKILAQYQNHKGYLMVKLYANNSHRSISVHRLVALAFICNPNNMPQVNHIDGDKTNTYVGNLEWVSGAENIRHAVSNGLINYRSGDAHTNALIPNSLVEQICVLLSQGLTNREINNLLNINNTYLVSDIRRGKRWKSISKKYNIGKCVKRKVFDEEIIHQICRMLELNYTTREIRKTLPNISPQQARDLIKNIRSRKYHTEISNKYTFNSKEGSTTIEKDHDKYLYIDINLG